MSAAVQHELDRLLEMVEEHLSTRRAVAVDERYRTAVSFEKGMPPLVCVFDGLSKISYPSPWNQFVFSDYREAFYDPAAMLKNQLMLRVVPGLITGDDSPLAVRSDFGTVMMHSALGGQWSLKETGYPWANAITDLEHIREIARGNFAFDKESGLIPRARQTLSFYHETLAQYPALREEIQVSLPDLQGPFDTANLLMGDEIFYIMHDEPELLHDLLSAVTDATLNALEIFRPYEIGRLAPAAITQHEYVVPGSFMIRTDSSILISADMYSEMVRPYEDRLLTRVNGGTIHFCGKGEHLIDPMLEIKSLKGLDFGDPQLMDIEGIFQKCKARGVMLTNLRPGRQALISGEASRRFPTGVVFCYNAENFEDACDTVRGYRASHDDNF